ncbi:MAG: VapC toxin family PIN domain ribonuclease [Betaproteobacteria bacterium]|nr:MAG: VapC toxin family PIN domain ribonuclease [Betaproteobacteria bacterium]
MRSLYDVNVLIALFDPQHSAHNKAMAWHATAGELGWATCPITQNGLLRIVSQPRYPNPTTVAQLLQSLSIATADASHQFWADDISLTSAATINPAYPLTSGVLTDVYLLALAVNHAGRLVTLDAHIPRAAVAGAQPEHLVVL